MKHVFWITLFAFLFVTTPAYAGGGRFDMHGGGNVSVGSWFDVSATVYNVERSQVTPGGHGEFQIANRMGGQECVTTTPISDSQGEFHGRCRSPIQGMMTIYLQSTDTGERSGDAFFYIIETQSAVAPAAPSKPVATPAGPLGPCGSGFRSIEYELTDTGCGPSSYKKGKLTCNNGYTTTIQKNVCTPQQENVWVADGYTICNGASCPAPVKKTVSVALPKASPKIASASATPTATPSATPVSTESAHPIVGSTSKWQWIVSFIRTFFRLVR